ncbi:MAG: NAD(P)-dependent alcohol dehydrogenase [Deltaproteobacteria bacterium]|nr:NAD(P)-dependent alcohol dehydrogenase [Deltaproteobacteria bacterium]
MPRALVFDRYGGLDVLSVRDLPLPSPKADQVRVRVRAAALNPKDALVRKGRFALLSGRRFPKRVGVDFAGEVVEAGPASGLHVGQRVFGVLEEIRYLRGTVAEEVVCARRECGLMPEGLSFVEAAGLPLVSLTALQALRDLAHVRPGDRVGIHGASGGLGTVAIQIAKAMGAHVTTTSSEGNRALCTSLGADEALDYASDDLLRGRFRVIFDVFGNLSFTRAKPALERGGVFVSTVPSPRILLDAARTLRSDKRARLVLIRSRREDLDEVARMVARGQLRPIIDRVEPLDRAKDAIARLETRRARGKIVIDLDA